MTLIEKLDSRQRLTLEDGIKLYDLDLLTLGKYANNIREEKFARKTYYNINRHINPTNICKDICKFCAYSASRKNPNQYTMTHDEILKIVEEIDKKITEDRKKLFIILKKIMLLAFLCNPRH